MLVLVAAPLYDVSTVPRAVCGTLRPTERTAHRRPFKFTERSGGERSSMLGERHPLAFACTSAPRIHGRTIAHMINKVRYLAHIVLSVVVYNTALTVARERDVEFFFSRERERDERKVGREVEAH